MLKNLGRIVLPEPCARIGDRGEDLFARLGKPNTHIYPEDLIWWPEKEGSIGSLGLFHTIQYTRNPRSCVSIAYRLLREGGLLFLTVTHSDPKCLWLYTRRGIRSLFDHLSEPSPFLVLKENGDILAIAAKKPSPAMISELRRI